MNFLNDYTEPGVDADADANMPDISNDIDRDSAGSPDDDAMDDGEGADDRDGMDGQDAIDSMLDTAARGSDALRNMDSKSQQWFVPSQYKTWAVMPDGVNLQEVLIYSKVPSLLTDVTCEAEAAGVLRDAFPRYIIDPNAEMNISAIVSIIEHRYNYEVFSISRVQNIRRAAMYEACKRCYDIKEHRTVYHGTTMMNANSISATGFREACAKRGMYGKGSYFATNVWQAITYAEPAPCSTQTLFVCHLLEGQSTVGTCEQTCFGTNADGVSYITTTNSEKTIYCASMDSQILVTHRIEMRFLANRPHTTAVERSVSIYNFSVWGLIVDMKMKAKIADAASQSAKQASKALVPCVDMQKYGNLCVGDRVKITKPFLIYNIVKNKEGILRRIFKDTRLHYCVEICDLTPDSTLACLITKANERKPSYPGQNPLFVALSFQNFEKVTEASIVGVGVGGPTVASGAGSGGGGSAVVASVVV